MAQEPPVRIERRLSAILVADVADYSRLMHEQEEATHARWTHLLASVVRPAIAEYGGRIVKNTGDGFVATFHSAVDAVRAAIRVQGGVQESEAAADNDHRIAFRIGINIGDVMVEPHDIFGDDVNIAARLESIAEPGGTVISASAYEQVRGRIAADFVDLGEQHLKNIARPVRAFAMKRDAGNARAPGGQAPGSNPRANASPPPNLSIVVLPFTNIGGGPEQDYFVDGMIESLTTDLSRMHGSFVIARNTAFTFKGKAIDVKSIGRELNVRYVLEGAVQRGGNRLRVNVQLIDAESGSHLWAERFEKPVTDLFEMQDEIVSRIANMLDAGLVAAEARKGQRSQHAGATDLFFQGIDLIYRAPTPEHLARAQDLFKRALVLAPDTAAALVGLGVVGVFASLSATPAERAMLLTDAEANATRALALAPNFPLAHLVLGNVFTFTNRAREAIAEFEQALALDRNLADAHASIGLAKSYLGRGEETEAHVLEALRLSPRDTFAYRWIFMVGAAKLRLEAYHEAVAWLRRSVEANRNFPMAHFYLAAALILTGAQEQAEAEVRAGLALDPAFTVSRILTPIFHETFRNRMIEALRKAGVPE
jgi:TolB-like protein/class 3 adenylate cyclase